MEWDTLFLNIAKAVAEKSKDKSTKVGCVIAHPTTNDVISIGYNGFPRGVDDTKEEWHQRPKKYLVTAHAELNAVCNAARLGKRVSSCTAYITLPPCSACALALIQAGIGRIVALQALPEWRDNPQWKEQLFTAKEICQATRVALEIIEKKESSF